jgi:hypothetical protein
MDLLMPYKSPEQRAYMRSHLPKLAAKWDKKYGRGPKKPRGGSNRTVVTTASNPGERARQKGLTLYTKFKGSKKRRRGVHHGSGGEDAHTRV